jgi:hypothetical protein
MAVDNNVMRVIPIHEALDEHFLYRFLRTVDLGGLANATTVPSSEVSRRYPDEVAPLAEPRRIVPKVRRCRSGVGGHGRRFRK